MFLIVHYRRQQYVGQASFIEFEHSSIGGKRLLVATEENVLASINSRNGQIGKSTSFCTMNIYNTFPDILVSYHSLPLVVFMCYCDVICSIALCNCTHFCHTFHMQSVSLVQRLWLDGLFWPRMIYRLCWVQRMLYSCSNIVIVYLCYTSVSRLILYTTCQLWQVEIEIHSLIISICPNFYN